MIAAALLHELPAGTRYERRAGGFALALPGNAEVQVRERNRPLRAAAALFADLGLASPRPLEPKVTREGELAALAHDDTVAAGLVFADDFYRLVAGRIADAAAAPALRAAVVRLTLELPLGLAHRRRRLFAYAPPPGWEGRRRHRLIAEWLAPGFPSEPAMLTVFPARPLGESQAGAVDRQLHEMTWVGYQVESASRPRPVAAAAGLTGVTWTMAGRWMGGSRTITQLAVLSDGSFQYLVRLDDHDEDGDRHRAVLDALVRSIRPVPAREGGDPPFGHMGE